MDNRLLVARVSEFALSLTRTYLNGQPRTAERDNFYFHVLDVVHNVPMWFVRDECDPHEMLLQYLECAPSKVRSWFMAQIDGLRAECEANTAGPSAT